MGTPRFAFATSEYRRGYRVAPGLQGLPPSCVAHASRPSASSARPFGNSLTGLRVSVTAIAPEFRRICRQVDDLRPTIRGSRTRPTPTTNTHDQPRTGLQGVVLPQHRLPKTLSPNGGGGASQGEPRWRSMTGGSVPANPQARERSRFRCRCRCSAC